MLGPSNVQTVVVLSWPHQTNVVETIGRAISAGLEGVGYRVLHIDCTDRLSLETTLNGAADPAFVVALGSVPLRVQRNGDWLHRSLACPVYLLFLDPPIYEYLRCDHVRAFCDDARSRGDLHVVSLDRGYGEIMARLIGRPSIYLPYAGFYAPLRRVERQERVAVFGNIVGQLADVSAGSAAEVLAVHAPPDFDAAARERLLAALDDPQSPSNVATLMIEHAGVPVSRFFSPDMLTLATHVDSFEKRRRRIMAVGDLRGLPVDFFGEGWNELFGDTDGFRFMASITFESIGAAMQHYAAVLSFDPNWDHGLHDRVYTGVGMGCRVLTNDSFALAEAALGEGRVLAYAPARPRTRMLAEMALAAPEPDRDETMALRTINSWFARMDVFTSMLEPPHV